jgi:hypothetical protein
LPLSISAMVRRLAAPLARHRRPILIVTAVLVIASLAARAAGADPDLFAPWLLAGMVSVCVLRLPFSLAPSLRRGDLDAAGGTARTPPDPTTTLDGAGLMFLLGALALHPTGTTPMGVPIPLGIAAIAVLIALNARGFWHGTRLTITPDGLYSERSAGTLTVP